MDRRRLELVRDVEMDGQKEVRISQGCRDGWTEGG